MVWGLHDAQRRERLLILVSKLDHCLNDLLYRYRTGDLRVEIPAIVSNHPDLEPLARWHGIPFHHLPVAAPNAGGAGSGDPCVWSTSWRSTWWCSPATCRS